MPEPRHLLPLLGLSGCLCAADFHVSPADAGAAQEIFNKRMQPGDRMLLGAGIYQDLCLKLVTGGADGRPKTIEAAAGAVMVSSWSVEKPDKGASAITLAPGLRHVVLRNLSIQRYCIAIRADRAPENPRGNLVFENLSMERMRHGFYLSDCDDVVISGCQLKRYSKHGVRFEQGCDRVALRDCVADCSEGDVQWETRTELFPFGFCINDGGAPNTGFRFENCVARNHIKSNQTVKYTNGDGFVVEGNARDVAFRGCRALRNQDGGFDLKVKDVRLDDCVATGQRRDYRVWHSGTLTNCFGGWSEAGLWVKEGPVEVSRCTFLHHRKSSVEAENPAKQPVLQDCLIVSNAPGNFGGGNSNVVAKSAADLGITDPKPGWDGIGNLMNSSAHSNKGYRSD